MFTEKDLCKRLSRNYYFNSLFENAYRPKNKGNVIETLKKEQKAIDEISKLKEDIEGLASSFKVDNLCRTIINLNRK